MRAIRALGCWGEQGGLLSVGEMCLLRELACEGKAPILEVGHYYGLSTTVLKGPNRVVVTVDHHAGDNWVPEPAGVAKFLSNMGGCEFVAPLFMNSRYLVAPLHYTMVFYDGDHGDEQMRFTVEVIRSDRVQLFVFDDRDFPVPSLCCEYLRSRGWKDESPPLHRGPQDKASEDTMTLGVFRRVSL